MQINTKGKQTFLSTSLIKSIFIITLYYKYVEKKIKLYYIMKFIHFYPFLPIFLYNSVLAT